MEEGWFSVPTRLYLSEEERDKVLRIVQEQGIELGDLLTDLLRDFLLHHAESECIPSPSPPVPEGSLLAESTRNLAELEEEIQKLRDEIERLKKRAELDDEQHARWLKGYIEDMEQEIERMENIYRARTVARNPTRQ